MLNGPKTIILELPAADSRKKVAIGGQEIAIRNLLQDQHIYEPIEAVLISCDRIALSEYYNTTTILHPGTTLLMDWRAGMTGTLIETLEDGRRIVACNPFGIAGYRLNNEVKAYGETILCRKYDQEKDFKSDSGLLIQAPPSQQFHAIAVESDLGYKHALDIKEDDVLIHYTDTDIEYRLPEGDIIGIRHKDVLAIKNEAGIDPVNGCVVMEAVGYDKLGIIIPDECRQLGVSRVLKSGSKHIPVDAVVIHNRGELTMPYRYLDLNVKLTREEFVYCRTA